MNTDKTHQALRVLGICCNVIVRQYWQLSINIINALIDVFFSKIVYTLVCFYWNEFLTKFFNQTLWRIKPIIWVYSVLNWYLNWLKVILCASEHICSIVRYCFRSFKSIIYINRCERPCFNRYRPKHFC